MFDCDEEYLLKKTDEQMERWLKAIADDKLLAVVGRRK